MSLARRRARPHDACPPRARWPGARRARARRARTPATTSTAAATERTWRWARWSRSSGRRSCDALGRPTSSPGSGRRRPAPRGHHRDAGRALRRRATATSGCAELRRTSTPASSRCSTSTRPRCARAGTPSSSSRRATRCCARWPRPSASRRRPPSIRRAAPRLGRAHGRGARARLATPRTRSRRCAADGRPRVTRRAHAPPPRVRRGRRAGADPRRARREASTRWARLMIRSSTSRFAEIEGDAGRHARWCCSSGKPDNFIAGADIKDFTAIRSAIEGETLSRSGQAILDRLEALRLPGGRRHPRRLPRRRPGDRARLPLPRRHRRPEDRAGPARGEAGAHPGRGRHAAAAAARRPRDRARPDPHRAQR